MLYYRAASVLHQATGEPIDGVYAELARRTEAGLGNDTEDVTAQYRHFHYVGSPQLQRVMTSVAVDVYLEHPLHYILTIPVGLYRTLFQVTGILLWPGIVWNAALLLAASLGAWQMLMQRRWIDTIFLLLPSVYFVAGTLVVQTSGIDTRARVMITPLLAIMAAYGIMYFFNRRIRASAPLSPPARS